MLQHLADGPAIRHITEFNWADIVRIGCNIIHIRASGQKLAGIGNFLIGQLIVIGDQDAGDLSVLAVCRNPYPVLFQFP